MKEIPVQLGYEAYKAFEAMLKSAVADANEHTVNEEGRFRKYFSLDLGEVTLMVVGPWKEKTA